MVRIDGSDRMRLPPDSGLRPNAYSAREHASSQPTREAFGAWLQLLQRGPGQDAASELARALEQTLSQRAESRQAPPRALALTVLTAEPQGDGSQARVQLGNRVFTLTSTAPLYPGQTLTLQPDGDQLRVTIPQTPVQKLALLQAARQAQLSLLPTPSARTGLASLTPWLNASTQTSSQSLFPGSTAGAPGTRSAAGPQAVTGPGVVSRVARLLPLILQQWQSALPQAAHSTATSPPVAGPAGADSSAAAGLPVAADAIRQSQHWIPQLIQATRAQQGEVTPAALRATWQQWVASARQQVTNWPAPDLSQSRLTPLQPDTAGITRRPLAPAGQSTATWLKTQPLLSPAGTAPTRARTESTDAPAHQTLPADFWRLLAEQVIDQRLHQSGGRSLIPSLQEQLQRRAELALRQVTQTYNPAMLRQASVNQAAASGTAASAEQQTLLQVRQILEQFSQQQSARILQSSITEGATENRGTHTAIPVMGQDQVVWFDMNQWRAPEESDDDTQETPGSRFTLDLHFHLTPMAPVCARLQWQGSGYEILFLTRDTQTLQLFHRQLGDLDQRLQQSGLPVDNIQCRYGMPPRRPESLGPSADTRTSTQVDVRT